MSPDFIMTMGWGSVTRMGSTGSDFNLVLQSTLPHGVLSAVHLPTVADVDAIEATLRLARPRLLPMEQELADALSITRRVSFVGGRIALRAAMQTAAPHTREVAVLRTTRGAPLMPEGVLGSVSHKRRVAMALVALTAPDVHTLGVDVEEMPTVAELARPDLAPKILTSFERHSLGDLAERDAIAYRESVRLRFALKEAVYKAIDPHVHRYVRFQEVEVFPDLSGEVEVRLALPEFRGRVITVRAWWTQLEQYLVATAIASPLD